VCSFSFHRDHLHREGNDSPKHLSRIVVLAVMTTTKTHEAGVWEQNKGFVAWSKHSSEAAARSAAKKYSRDLLMTGPTTGGMLSWSGGFREIGETEVKWIRADHPANKGQ
jgi:hypothetical protein